MVQPYVCIATLRIDVGMSEDDVVYILVRKRVRDENSIKRDQTRCEMVPDVTRLSRAATCLSHPLYETVLGGMHINQDSFTLVQCEIRYLWLYLRSDMNMYNDTVQIVLRSPWSKCT